MATTPTASLLRRVRARLAASAAVEDLQTGVAAGGVAALAVLAGQRAGWFEPAPWTPLLAGVAIAAAIPAMDFLARRRGEREVRLLADARLGLSERLSTAQWALGAAAREPLAHLVVADADAAAARVRPEDVARAIRPRLRRRPLAVGGAALAGCVALLLWQPEAAAFESPAEKTARLAEESRVAEVAKKLEAQAKKVEEAAAERKAETLRGVAQQVRRAAQEMQRDPPRRETALTKLNRMSDEARREAHRKAGLREPQSPAEFGEAEREFAKLLEELSEAGLETMVRDLKKLEDELAKRPKGEGGPTPQDLRDLANRMDALRRAIRRAEEAGAERLAQELRKVANEDVLEQIASRMREIASKLDLRGYEGLQTEDLEPQPSLAEMSREELEDLLRELEQLAAMEDLANLIREGGVETRGGRRMRIRPGGSGT